MHKAGERRLSGINTAVKESYREVYKEIYKKLIRKHIRKHITKQSGLNAAYIKDGKDL